MIWGSLIDLGVESYSCNYKEHRKQTNLFKRQMKKMMNEE